MEFANNLILIGAGLVTLSIFAGLVSSRIGAPLLLVFLALGMLAGEDGPGGILFDDFQAAYIAGSTALAIILFDGGLRTTRQSIRAAWAPALALATVGVLITAILCGLFAAWILDLHWLQGLLIGSTVASTDAAAVFFLLHQHGLGLKDRLGATLEVESAINDPMAIFLTILCVELLQSGVTTLSWQAAIDFAGMFVVQIAGGAVFGLIGGYVLLQIINRLEIASGLYPIFALAFALLIFGLAQAAGASGFMAVYLAGLVLGLRRHRATLLINRFYDGLAWLSQIMMFLMLGLLVTPSQLLPDLIPALAIAFFLIVAARPIAVVLCLWPFRFTWREVLFISWVGLRGAVPIFLGTIPVLAGVTGAEIFFTVAFVVVLISLVVQGWTVAPVARRLKLERPPRPAPPLRADLDLPGRSGRDMAAYTVQPFSMATRRPLARLPLPDEVSIVSIIRDGRLQDIKSINRLAPGDYVLLLALSETMTLLDRFFAARSQRSGRSRPDEMVGEFVLDGDANLGAVADLYEFRIPHGLRGFTVGGFLRRGLLKSPQPGRRLHVGEVEFIVRAVDSGTITRVGLDVAPPVSARHWPDLLRILAVSLSEPLRQTLRRRRKRQRQSESRNEVGASDA
jgi:cell volume regulation protein A